MTVDGNVWTEVWVNANPVPAHRQKRLFDETREAAKVLQYLAGLGLGGAAQLLAPVLHHAAIVRILQEPFESVPDLKVVLVDAVRKLARASTLPCPPEVKESLCPSDNTGDFANRELLLSEVSRLTCLAEVKASRALSLHSKFVKSVGFQTEGTAPEDKEAVLKQMKEFVHNLYMMPEAIVLGAGRGPTGQMVRRMFRDAHKAANMITDDSDEDGDDGDDHGQWATVFPAPESKEFILRTWMKRPRPYSTKVPQRMYCCIKDDLRVAGAFTIDKQFL